VRFSAFVQTGCRAISSSYTMGIGSLSREENGLSMVLTNEPLPNAEVKVREELYLVSF
jgi:hypothetical protein